MVSIAIMIGGAVLNATAFIGGNHLARVLGGDNKAALRGSRRSRSGLHGLLVSLNFFTPYLYGRQTLED